VGDNDPSSLKKILVCLVYIYSVLVTHLILPFSAGPAWLNELDSWIT
jgi:hypothetical protein